VSNSLASRTPPLAPERPQVFYTVAETALLVRTSAMTLYRAIQCGEFPAVRIRGRVIVPARVIEEMINAAIDGRTVVDAADWARPGGIQ